MNTNVWLIRHGEPGEDVRHRCYGALNIGLSDNGRAQMERVAGELKSVRFDAIYSSSRLRAIESARVIAQYQECACEVHPDLGEINFGDFEGMTFDDIAKRYPDVYQKWMKTPTEVQFPNGESFAEMHVRVMRAFESIQRRHEGHTIAIVTHGGVIRILIALALQIPSDCIFRVAQSHAAMNLVVWEGNYPVLQFMNVSAK